MLILAATSHDFWLKFLTPPVWKGIHFLIYPAYAAVVGHVAFGSFQSRENDTLAVIFAAGALLVALLHILAAVKERGSRTAPVAEVNWFRVCRAEEIEEGFARVALLPSGDRVAVFRHEDQLSAISKRLCPPKWPAGRGAYPELPRDLPWHGFQYDVRNGRSPAPFTEKVPTYRLRVEAGEVLVDPEANPPPAHRLIRFQSGPVKAPTQAGGNAHMSQKDNSPFFVGYLPVPAGLRCRWL